MGNWADLGNGIFRNPILFADYSDPDVIRVGDTYYMTASSFNYTPGLPLQRSLFAPSFSLDACIIPFSQTSAKEKT